MSSFSLLSLSLSCTVHCRKRKMDHGILKDPSTSSNTYWQIERESNQCSGEPLTWGERCRIRHMPTRLYLAVVKRDMFKVLHCWFNERIPTDAHCFHTHQCIITILNNYINVIYVPTLDHITVTVLSNFYFVLSVPELWLYIFCSVHTQHF